MERDSDVRPCIETPEHLSVPEIKDAGDIPTLADLGLTEPVDDPRAVFHYKGDETAALLQLQQYIQNLDFSPANKGAKHSAKKTLQGFPAWISLGCLSPRMVYSRGIDASLAWRASFQFPADVGAAVQRDYFQVYVQKYGKQFFDAGRV